MRKVLFVVACGVMLAILIGLSVVFANTGVVSTVLAILCGFMVFLWVYQIWELAAYRAQQGKTKRN